MFTCEPGTCPGSATLSLLILAATAALGRVLLGAARSARVHIIVAVDGAPRPVFTNGVLFEDRRAAESACAPIERDNAACCAAVISRISLVRRAQFRDSFSLPRIAVGWHAVMPLRTRSGTFPLAWTPNEGAHAALRRWSVSTGSSYVDPAHLEELGSREDGVLGHARMLESAAIEVTAVVLPALAIGAILVRWGGSGGERERRRPRLSTIPHHQRCTVGTARVKLLLGFGVVFGHAYEMCQSAGPDPLKRVLGVGFSSMACAGLFFLSGFGVTLSSQSDHRQRLGRRIAKLWCFVAGALALGCMLHQETLPLRIALKVLIGLFCEFNAAPGAAEMAFGLNNDLDLQPFAPSLWTVPYTVLGWWCVAFLESVGGLRSETLTLACCSLAATGASVHLLSFFAGALLACLVREERLDLDTTCTVQMIACLVPWPLVCIQPAAAGRSRVLLAAFCFGLLVLVRRCDHCGGGSGGGGGGTGELVSKMIDGRIWLLSLFCFASAFQRALIDRWGVNTPLPNFCYAAVAATVLAYGTTQLLAMLHRTTTNTNRRRRRSLSRQRLR